MIYISIISIIISFLIQGIISNYLGYISSSLSVFSTIYVLINLLILRQYFENEKKYIILIIILGLFTDVVYSNVFLLDACLFFVVSYFSKKFHAIFPYNLLTINISNLLCIFIYHILSFLILQLLRYDHYSFLMLLKILYSSILMTIIYTSLTYFIIDLINKKYELKDIK